MVMTLKFKCLSSWPRGDGLYSYEGGSEYFEDNRIRDVRFYFSWARTGRNSIVRDPLPGCYGAESGR
jgi:hypothetical protein